MKRAVSLCIVTAALLLFGLPSASLQAGSQFDSNSGGGPSVVVPGGGGVPTPAAPGGGGGGGGGGTEGDADGLSGAKNRQPTSIGLAAQPEGAYVLRMWWKFMLFLAR